MDQDTLGTAVDLGPGDITLHGDPAPPPHGKGHMPHFSAMSVVAKRSSISATAELSHFARTPLVRPAVPLALAV